MSNSSKLIAKGKFGAKDGAGAGSNSCPWVHRFVGLAGNEFLCEVDRDYIQDKFNLTDLDEVVPHFKEALRIILHSQDEASIDQILSTATTSASTPTTDDDNSAASRRRYANKIVSFSPFCNAPFFKYPIF